MTYTNTAEELDNFLNMLYDLSCLSDQEVEMRTDYSGRGMYGKTCVGFTTDSAIQLAMAIATTLADLARYAYDDGNQPTYPEWFELHTATDSMGRSTIVYFPNWQLAE